MHSSPSPLSGTAWRQYHFAPRMAKTPKSFIREIFKVTENSGIVSFAGGLSNSALIDVDGIAQAAARVLADDGRSVLQYSTTEGYLPLRQFIADRYKKRLGLTVLPEEILITNGSRQCLDLIGKVLINADDHIAIEWPGYLGAIQAFSLPSFRGYIPEQTIITGSFSKILAPGMRLGWIMAPEAIMEQIVIAKQASDLPSNSLSQRIAVECLSQGTIDHHIKKI